MNVVKKYGEGLLVVLAITSVSYLLQWIGPIKNLHISTLMIAIIIGAIVNNTIGIKGKMLPGVTFSAKKLLRFAVVLLGFKLSLAEVGELGYQVIAIIFIVSSMTLLFTYYVGKWMGISNDLVLLIAAGTSICGASAVAATNSVHHSKEEDAAFAIGVVTIFGTLFMFTYPVIAHLFQFQTFFYSMWAGVSIHEVAQVVAAGNAYSPEAGTEATLIKLTRVLFIIPFTIGLSLLQKRKEGGPSLSLKTIPIPWFVVFFLIVVVINSLLPIPNGIHSMLIKMEEWVMTMAMAGLGLGISAMGMKKVGAKPLYLGLAASLFISVVSLLFISFL